MSKPPEKFYTIDMPRPDLTPEQRVAWMNDGVKSEIDAAFRDVIVVDYDKRTIPGEKADTDLKITVVLRHRSAVPGLAT